MPSADPRGAEIVRTIAEFESSVEAAEAALVTRDWRRVDDLLSMQHRITHALANLLDETRDVRPAAFTLELERRIDAIVNRRADQLQRLIAFNHLVRQRLTLIARSRGMRPVNVADGPPPRILNTVQ